MDETKLVAAICGSRKAYETLARIGFDPSDFSEAARCIVEAAAQQYKRDAKLESIDRDVLRSQVRRRFGDNSMADSVMEFVDGFPSDISSINIAEEYRLARLSRCATSLATLLAQGQFGEATQELLAKYQRLSIGEESQEFKARLTAEDFEEKDGARIKLSPSSLNSFIGGGVLRGHNITVYGRPESGKSMFAINQAAYACKQGLKVLYVANEEPAQDITRRLLARLCSVEISRLTGSESVSRAIDKAGSVYDNWFLMHQTGATARDIAIYCQKIEPDLVIIDQLKNLACKDDNRVLQLDKLARQIRDISIEYNCVTMGVTQAGESAENKLVLTQTDIEWSNTGIPGACDLMIGVGVDSEFKATNKRMLSVPRNKANGRHGAFHVWVDASRTAFLSKARTK